MKRIIALAGCLLIAASLVCSAGGKKTTKTVNITITKGETAVWPFTEKKISSTTKEPSLVGIESTLTTKDGISMKVFSTGGAVVNSKAGLRCVMSKDDYYILPALPGMAPIKVSLISGGRLTECLPRIESLAGAPVEGGDAISGKTPMGEKIEWSISGVAPGEAVKLVFGKAGMSDIREFEIVYEGIMPKVKKAKPAKVKGKVVTVDFRDEADQTSVWPFSEKKPSPSRPVTDADFSTYNLEEFSVKCSDKVYLNSKGGFCFGNGKYDRLTLPAFGTRALVRIEMTAGGTSTMGKPEIKYPNNWNTVEGGEAFPTFKINEVYTWELKNTLPGERYRIVLTAPGSLAMKKLVLYYE